MEVNTAQNINKGTCGYHYCAEDSTTSSRQFSSQPPSEQEDGCEGSCQIYSKLDQDDPSASSSVSTGQESLAANTATINQCYETRSTVRLQRSNNDSQKSNWGGTGPGISQVQSSASKSCSSAKTSLTPNVPTSAPEAYGEDHLSAANKIELADRVGTETTASLSASVSDDSRHSEPSGDSLIPNDAEPRGGLYARLTKRSDICWRDGLRLRNMIPSIGGDAESFQSYISTLVHCLAGGVEQAFVLGEDDIKL